MSVIVVGARGVQGNGVRVGWGGLGWGQSEEREECALPVGAFSSSSFFLFFFFYIYIYNFFYQEEDRPMGTRTPVVLVCLTAGIVIFRPHPHRHAAAYRTWEQNEWYSRCPQFRAQEMCQSRDERPGLPLPNRPNYGLCGRNAASSNNLNSCPEFRSPGAVWKSRWTSWSSPSLTGLCGRNAASNNNLNSCPEFRSPWAVWKSRWTSWSSPSLTGLCGRNAARSPWAVWKSRWTSWSSPSLTGLCGRNARTTTWTVAQNFGAHEPCESRGGRPGLPRP